MYKRESSVRHTFSQRRPQLNNEVFGSVQYGSPRGYYKKNNELWIDFHA
jgi:hypothetical protein